MNPSDEGSPADLGWLEAQLFPGKPALNHVVMVEKLVRQFGYEVLTARDPWLRGEKTGEQVTEEIVTAAKRMACIFNGQDETYYAPPWNSPQQLGSFLKKRFGWTEIPAEDCVLNLFLWLGRHLADIVEANEKGEQTDEQTATALDVTINAVWHYLLGLEPSVATTLPTSLPPAANHPLLITQMDGKFGIRGPRYDVPFEQALQDLVPLGGRSWNVEDAYWVIEPAYQQAVLFLLRQHFPAGQVAALPLPDFLPEGVDDSTTFESLASTLESCCESEREHLREANQQLFWDVLFSLWRACRRQGVDVPPWLFAELREAPPHVQSGAVAAPAPPATLGRQSRWKVEFDDTLLHAHALFRSDGSIVVRPYLAVRRMRWRVLIHELVHSVAVRLEPGQYESHIGWEETEDP